MISYEPLCEADRLQAESWRYGDRVVSVLPLPSGRFAVIGTMRTLIGYCNTIEEAVTMNAEHCAERERQRYIPHYRDKALIVGALEEVF